MADEAPSSKHCAITSIKLNGFVNCIIGNIAEGRQYPESEFENLEIKFSDFEDPEDAISVWRLLINVCNKKKLS